MILMMENFRSYPTADEMLVDGGKNGPWTTLNKVMTSANQTLIDNPTWKGDGTSLRALRNQEIYDSNSPLRDFHTQSVKVFCAQFIVGSSGHDNPIRTESCSAYFFQEGIDSFTLSTSTIQGICIKSDSVTAGTTGSVGVFYNIPTNLSGSMNQLKIGSLKPWMPGRHYHVEIKVDHTNPVARIIVYVNGVLELDTTYDRDRIDNGYQVKDFRRVMLGGGSSSSSRRPPIYSNLVIYTDDADTTFPMGPIDLTTVSPNAGQGYDGLRAAPNADDVTSVAVLPGATLNGTFDDLTLSPNPVLAVDLLVRHGSIAGLEPSQITTSARKSDGTVAVSTLTTAAPNLPPVHRRVRLTGPLTQADVNGMTFRIVAAGS